MYKIITLYMFYWMNICRAHPQTYFIGLWCTSESHIRAEFIHFYITMRWINGRIHTAVVFFQWNNAINSGGNVIGWLSNDPKKYYIVCPVYIYSEIKLPGKCKSSSHIIVERLPEHLITWLYHEYNLSGENNCRISPIFGFALRFYWRSFCLSFL